MRGYDGTNLTENSLDGESSSGADLAGIRRGYAFSHSPEQPVGQRGEDVVTLSY
jgi:hypothetical protein